VTIVRGLDGAATTAVTQYATVAALRAATSSVGPVQLLGYYAAGDGGGGLFRWDATDTTSADNGGTIITPTGGLASSGRWRRLYEGEVNARWFGVHPGQTDNTAALQAAVTWVGTDLTRTPNSTITGGTVFIPFGYYRFTFGAGTSGLSTITVGSDNVLIRGEGRGTTLTVRSPSAQVARFFTFTQSARGQGGGVRDLHFEGNSQLQWCIYLTTWRNAAFENVSARDVFSGLLDAESTNASSLGEDITVRHLDHISSSGTNSCFTQYGVRFRATSGGTTWTECSIRDCLFVNCWDTGVVLDGCSRFTVSQVGAACNSASTNTIDGASHSGILHAVTITNSVTSSWTADTGFHLVETIYMESHSGAETFAANAAVWIDTPVGQTVGLNRLNRVRDVAISTTLGPSVIRITNTSATTGLTGSNTFEGNRRAINNAQVQIGAGAADTYLYLTPNAGQLSKILDQGTRTYVNGARNYAYGAGYPNSVIGSSSALDVGMITRDTATGRVCWQDRTNTPVLIGPRPGSDVVATHGAQRITSLSTPAAPSIATGATGSTTWTYYVVAVDKDGNKTPPSAAGTTTTGPASLAGSNLNKITWSPVDGAVTYDLLRGGTTTSVGTGLVGCYFEDNGISTAAYTASATSPPGTLVVDADLTAGLARLTNVASPPATPSGGGVLYVESGALKYKGSSGTVTTLGSA
jgi:hypothetical protein